MRPRMLVAFGIALTVASLGSAAAQAQDGYHHGRLRYVEPGVTVQHVTDDDAGGSAEEAAVNEPFLPGDRIWTDASGRAEFQFADGSVVRLDRRGKLDYAGHEEDREERVTLRLWSGSVMLRVRTRSGARFEVETPGGMVLPAENSAVRIDVDAGEARVSIHQGEAVLDDSRDRVRLSAGERTYARWGSRAEEPERFDVDEKDDFLQWEADREASDRWASEFTRYLPGELAAYSEDFDRNGDWRNEAGVGYVWVPQVEVGWRPYWNGHWAWTPYGWTWVPYEPWGWAPSHYGRWGYSGAFGWYWMPGRTWGPAWVSWAAGGGYVGWCPLDRHDRPVSAALGVPYDYRGSHDYAVTRGGVRIDAWSVVRQGQLGRHDVARLRVPADRVQPNLLRVADTAQLRPTRDGSHLAQSDAVPRAIRLRPTIGDSVRELATDNKTTIPSPWFRRGGAAAAYGVQAGQGGAERRGETRTAPRQDGGEVSGTGATHSRPVPWFRPSENGARSTGNERGGAVERGGAANGSGSGSAADNGAAGRRDEGASRPPASTPPASQPRHDAGESHSGAVYRPQPHDDGGSAPHASGGDSGGARSHGESHSGAGEARPSGGGNPSGQARPSGGGQSSGGASSRGESHTSSGSKSSDSKSSDSKSSAEHAAPRPRNR